MLYLEQAFSLNPDLQMKITSFGQDLQGNKLTLKGKKQVMATIGQTDLELMFEYF